MSAGATRRKICFPRYGAAHGCAQEPTRGSAVEFWEESVRKNQPLVPRSNIAGSWTRGGGGGTGDSVPTVVNTQGPRRSKHWKFFCLQQGVLLSLQVCLLKVLMI